MKKIIAGLIGIAVLILCGIGTTLAAMSSADKAQKEINTWASPSVTPVRTSPPPVKGKAPTISGDDIKLTVKTTKKDCFGSAGCNVEYTIKVSLAQGVDVPDSCDVTYMVRGLQDPQVGTLELTEDGKYSQDPFQFGQTKKSTDKLTATVTEVECAS